MKLSLSPLVLVATAALALAAVASAHAHVSPPIVVKGESQVFTLAVPTEKEDATTTKVELTPPDGFSIDSFIAAPGWKRDVAADRLGRGRRDHEGDVGRRQGADRRGTRLLSSSAAPTRRRRTRSACGRRTPTARSSTGPGRELRHSGADDRGEGLARRRRRLVTLAIVALVVGVLGVVLGGRRARCRLGEALARVSRAGAVALVGGRCSARAAGRGVGARGAAAHGPLRERDGQHAAEAAALTYSEAVEPRFAIVSVTDADGAPADGRPAAPLGRRTRTRSSCR